MLCPQHAKLLLQPLTALIRGTCHASGFLVPRGEHSYSTDGSQQDGPSSDIDAEFQRKLTALQGDQASADLDAIRHAAEQLSSSKRRPRVNLLQQQQQPHLHAEDGQDSSSSGGDQPQALWSRRYGYAVLGGVNPEASQQEAGAQQPKLHPTRDFKQGDMYDPSDLTPLSREEQESWLPQQRRSTYFQRVPKAVVKQQLDYKNVDFLLNFVSDSGRLKPRRSTGLNPVLQACVARTVKMARQMALLPYEMRVGEGGEGDRWRVMRQFKAEQRAQSM
eukprot:GHUV01007918.1.p1 GENE.GHUV01007918.1~~GHUV01007918.1.p1  ORF type:complete len:276 (+),score=84.35 GHUV01007918.1:161-988(+)